MIDRLRLVGPVERALFLKTISAVAALEPEELATLANHTRERYFRKGAKLLRRGERVEHIYAVVEGRVRLEGPGVPAGPVGPQAAIGVLAVLSRSAEGIEATAETDTLTLEVDADTLVDLYEDHFPALLRQIRHLSRQLLGERRRLAPGTFLSSWSGNIPYREESLDLVERLVIVRKAVAFQRAGLDALAQLAEQMQEVRFPPGHRIWSQGDPSGWLCLIVAGRVACNERGQGEFACGPGYPLGNIESLCGEPRWFDAVAETPVLGLYGETEGFLDVLEDHFEMAMDFVAAMSANLIQLRDQGHRDT